MRAELGEGASQLRTGAKRSGGRVHTGVEGGVQDGVQAGCVGRGPGGSRHGWRERWTPGDWSRAALPLLVTIATRISGHASPCGAQRLWEARA